MKQEKVLTILNELVEDRNAIEIATKSTSAIDVIRVQFNLQHEERKKERKSFYFLFHSLFLIQIF